MSKLTVKDLYILDNLTVTEKENKTAQQHIDYINGVAEDLGITVKVSKRSGVRPKWYELQKGRSGGSEHSTYELPDRGAVDYVYNKDLLNRLIEDKFYTRVCYYPNNGFIHADRKPFSDKGTRYYECQSPTGKWKLKRIDY